jgi:hypothetical protein
MKPIRIVAFGLTLLLLFTTGVLIIQRGTTWNEAAIISLMVSAPMMSLFALLEMKRRGI